MNEPEAPARLAWVDVFAPRRLCGNPLAVVLDAHGWSDTRMQAVATELGLSETAIALPATVAQADIRLRIFTPRRELRMAGHPVVGAAWVLHAAGLIGTRACIETGAGVLAVRVTGEVATMQQAPPEAGPLVDAEEVAHALGARPADAGAPPAQVWSTGLPQLMLPAPDAATVTAARPDMSRLTRLCERDGYVGVSLYALVPGPAPALSAHARFFAPALGVPEDPATGSAAGALGACLAAAGRGRGDVTELIVRQGMELGRPGEMAVRVESRDGAPVRVQVGGRVLPVLEGRFVPGALG